MSFRDKKLFLLFLMLFTLALSVHRPWEGSAHTQTSATVLAMFPGLNEDGDQILKTKTKRLMVFPNMCIDYDLDISRLKTGSYQCLLTADARKEYVGTNISLNIK